MDLERIDDHYLTKRLGDLHNQLPTRIWGAAVNSSYFRVRVDPSNKPETVDELKAPPPECVIGYQRCNRPNNPMFYASSSPKVALSEVNPQVGQKIYLTQWKVRERFPVNHSLNLRLYDPNTFISNGEEFFSKYFRKKFSERIEDSFSYKYKLTAGISNLLSANYPKSPNLDINKDGLVGLVYPSIQDSTKDNLALHPEMVERCLGIECIVEATVLSIKKGIFRIRSDDISRTVSLTNIKWEGVKGLMPISWNLVQSTNSTDEYEL